MATCVSLPLSCMASLFSAWMLPLSSLGLPGRTKGSNRSRTGERPVDTQPLVRTTLSQVM